MERPPEIASAIRVEQNRGRVIRYVIHGAGPAFLAPFEPGAIHGSMPL